MPITIHKDIKEENIVCNVRIEGNPVSAARPRFSFRNHHAYTPINVKKYKELIYWKIKEKYPNCRIDTDGLETYGLYVKFYRSNRQRIDIDNLVKTIMDSITLAEIWKDDYQLQELF